MFALSNGEIAKLKRQDYDIYKITIFCRLFRRDRDRSSKGTSRDISPSSKGYNRGVVNPRRSYSRTPSPSRLRSPRYSSRRERSPRGRNSPPREYREKRYLSSSGLQKNIYIQVLNIKSKI